MGKEEPITMWKVSESQGTFFNIARWGAWIRRRSVLCSVLVTQCIYMWRNPRSKKFYWAKTACHLITVWGHTKASFAEKKAAFVCAVCLVCELLSDTRLSPAVRARWAPSACLSYSQRYLRIPADKTIICSASPWFRTSGCVWCLLLVNWLEKDGGFEIWLAPCVYSLSPTASPYRSLVLSFSLCTLQQLGNLGVCQSAMLCISAHVVVVCSQGAKGHFSMWLREHMEKCSNLIPTALNRSWGDRK